MEGHTCEQIQSQVSIRSLLYPYLPQTANFSTDSALLRSVLESPPHSRAHQYLQAEDLSKQVDLQNSSQHQKHNSVHDSNQNVEAQHTKQH